MLSSCILDPGLIDELRTGLNQGDFYSNPNQHVWAALLAMVDASRPVDAVSLASELIARGRLELIGGTPYLGRLINETPAVAHVEEYARVVADLARRRRVITAAQKIAAEGFGDVGDQSEWLLKAEAEVAAAANDGATANESSLLRDLVPAQLIAMGARMAGGDGAPTEFARIRLLELRTKLLGGWRLAKLHVLAGRPGMGKTAAAVGCASGAASENEGVVFVSLEMTREELVQRIISSESMTSLRTAMGGELSSEQWSSVTAVAAEIGQWPMSLTHCPGASITKLRSVIRREITRVKRECGVAVTLVVVDYMQLIDGERRKGDSRESEVGDICRKLTALAGELNVAMLVMSQLNREVDKRPNKRPQLSDLRESGAIEQDAYSVSFLYRDEYYNPESTEAGVLEWIIAKHRNGPTGTVKLQWDGSCVRIDDCSTAPDGYECDFDNTR